MAHQIQGWRWNGRRYVSAKSIPLSDRGFRYGMSVFESIRVWNGAVEFWDQHVQQLHTTCAMRNIAVDEKAIADAIKVFQRAGVNGFARIYVMIEPREPEREESWELCFHDESLPLPFPGLKTGNYWLHCEALAQAKARRFDEALLFNDHAELISACCANIFLVQEDRILTPSRGSGCRPGVVREWVIKRRKVEERRLRREDVLKADEIFLTNSWLGIMPIATLEGRPLGPRSIGPKLVGEMERWRSV
jgi:4-amino-4-deoxychorismate lyase